ncbi:Do family serine endopeptidase [Qipengyuania sp. SS22]|uniref:Do family serine endopeptidase n=1 Tax=Qipengyuania sp. SS22 TaxID=2979461 RepID=UPI0021E5F627|nr:Do family serine endopeptidase [Qipengyuania sp. SS22]UYH54221.1 Do family serine endopeptidase [Qipengyuania sp. SS22]
MTSALLVGGAAISLATGYPAGAQVAQNDDSHMARVVPRAGAPESFADLTAQLQPAVVNISTRQRIEVSGSSGNPFAGTPFEGLFNRRGGSQQQEPQYREGQSLGSGFIISADGYVVTNNHVVAPPTSRRGTRGTVEEITVTLADGTEYDAELIGTDPQSDLAVLKVNRREPFPFVEFGDSRNARAGDWVIAIGNPFNLGGTVTSGIISAVLRPYGGGAYERYIQTDASINRGNSGGPLFDMQGNVIGINNAIISPTGGSVGIGFAIPAEAAKPIIDSLVSGEEIMRGYLGVEMNAVDEDIADALGMSSARGALLQRVYADQPGDKAGLRAGDVVLSVDGKPISADQSLPYVIANISPNKTVPMQILRDGRERTINVTLGRLPAAEELAEMRQQERLFEENGDGAQDDMAPESSNDLISEVLGVQVLPMNPRFARELGVRPDSGGVVVMAVDPSADAARRGIGRGTIIQSANYAAIDSVEGLEKQLSKAQKENREAILLRIRTRGGDEVSVPVRLRY